MHLAFIYFIFVIYNKPESFSLLKPFDNIPDYFFGLIACILFLTSTLIIAAVTHKFIEVNARNYLNNIIKSYDSKKILQKKLL